MCRIDQAPIDAFNERIKAGLSGRAQWTLLKDPVVLLNAKDLAQITKVHYMRGGCKEHAQMRLEEIVGSEVFLDIAGYEHFLKRDLELLATPFPVTKHLVERSVYEEHQASKKIWTSKYSTDDTYTTVGEVRKKYGFDDVKKAIDDLYGDGAKRYAQPMNLMLIQSTYEEAVKALAAKLNKIEYGVVKSRTPDDNQIVYAIDYTKEFGPQASFNPQAPPQLSGAGAYCGHCGKITSMCSCDLEETPTLLPIDLAEEKKPKVVTPLAQVLAKTEEVYQSAADGPQTCYLCARVSVANPMTGTSTLQMRRVRDGGMLICARCAFQHLTQDSGT
jgi:hypothetical protein